MNFPILVREGVELRRRVEADAEAVFQVIDKNRLYLKQWLPWLDDSKTVEDLRKYIQVEVLFCFIIKNTPLGKPKAYHTNFPSNLSDHCMK